MDVLIEAQVLVLDGWGRSRTAARHTLRSAVEAAAPNAVLRTAALDLLTDRLGDLDEWNAADERTGKGVAADLASIAASLR